MSFSFDKECSVRKDIAILLDEKAALRTRIFEYSPHLAPQRSGTSDEDNSKFVFGANRIERRRKRSRQSMISDHKVHKRMRGLIALQHNPKFCASSVDTDHLNANDTNLSHCVPKQNAGNAETSTQHSLAQNSHKGTTQSRHLEDRRIRERERELDRLGRLLRRAAELDVSRCCNDLRTLLLARSHSEEVGLHIPTPPTSQGQILFASPMLLNSYKNKDTNSQGSVGGAVEFPPCTSLVPLIRRRTSSSLQSLRKMNDIMEISDFLQTFNASLKIDQVPSAVELLGALIAIETNSREQKDAANRSLSTVAMALVEVLLPDLIACLSSSRLTNSTHHASRSWIDVNHMTWRSLARFLVLIAAFREMGFADSDLLSELCGAGGWSSHPNSESPDYYTMALIKARISLVKSKHPVFEESSECLIHIPVPRRSNCVREIGRVSGTNCFMRSQNRILSSQVNLAVESSPAQHHNNSSRGNPPRLNDSSSFCVSQWCLVVVEILLAQPESRKLVHLSECNVDLGRSEATIRRVSLLDIKGAVSAGRYAGSLHTFVSDVRQMFLNCHHYLQEGCDSMQAVTKLGAVFERLLREKKIGSSSQNYFRSCIGCRTHTHSSELLPLLRCDRCDAHYHVTCLQNPPSSLGHVWFCPLCSALIRGPGPVDGIVNRDVTFEGVRHTVESLLVPGRNTLLATPHVVIQSQLGELHQLVFDEFAIRAEMPRPSPSPVGHIENGGWALPGGKIPYKLDPAFSEHAANAAGEANDLSVFIRAIGALSNDDHLNQNDWVDVLGALVVCASSAVETSLCLSDHLADKKVDTLDGLRPDPDSDKSCLVDSFPEVCPSIEIPIAGSQRKKRELLLVAGVVQDAVAFVKLGVTNMEGTNGQLQLNAHRGIMQDLICVGGSCSSSNSIVNPATQNGTCVWCGGDYDYLRSSFLPARHEVRTVPIFGATSRHNCLPGSRSWPGARTLAGLALSHEFCSNCLTGQRAGTLSRKRQRMLMTYKEKQMFAGRGRTQPLGTDKYGRVYWYFTQHPNLISVRWAPVSLEELKPKSFNTFTWVCFCTISSIAQLISYLVKLCDAQYDLLLDAIMLAFPEASELVALSSDYLYSDCTYNRHVWSKFETIAVVTELHDSARSQQPQFQMNECVLVRVGQLVWSATVLSIAITKLHDTVYHIRYRQWIKSFDDWLGYECFVLNSNIINKVQSSLFEDDLVPCLARKSGFSLNQLNLIAFDFTGSSCVASCQTSSFVGEDCKTGDQKRLIRAALLTIFAALPAGSLTPKRSALLQMRALSIRCASSAVELTELVLGLEDSLNKSYLRSSWSTIRACLPTRTYFLKHASLSQVALLLSVLDRGIIYDQSQLQAFSLGEKTGLDKV